MAWDEPKYHKFRMLCEQHFFVFCGTAVGNTTFSGIYLGVHYGTVLCFLLQGWYLDVCILLNATNILVWRSMTFALTSGICFSQLHKWFHHRYVTVICWVGHVWNGLGPNSH